METTKIYLSSAMLLAPFSIILLSIGCAKKADVCDEAIKIVCISEYKDERMCKETKNLQKLQGKMIAYLLKHSGLSGAAILLIHTM